MDLQVLQFFHTTSVALAAPWHIEKHRESSGEEQLGEKVWETSGKNLQKALKLSNFGRFSPWGPKEGVNPTWGPDFRVQIYLHEKNKWRQEMQRKWKRKWQVNEKRTERTWKANAKKTKKAMKRKSKGEEKKMKRKLKCKWKWKNVKEMKLRFKGEERKWQGKENKMKRKC